MHKDSIARAPRQWCVVRPHKQERNLWDQHGPAHCCHPPKHAARAHAADVLTLNDSPAVSKKARHGHDPSTGWPGMVPKGITDRVRPVSRPASSGHSSQPNTPADRMRVAKKRSLTRAWALLMQQKGPRGSMRTSRPAKGKPFDLAHAMQLELQRSHVGRKAAKNAPQATTTTQQSNASARLEQVCHGCILLSHVMLNGYPAQVISCQKLHGSRAAFMVLCWQMRQEEVHVR